MALETLAGRYRLDEVVGKGGMSTVYRAWDLVLDRPVAVKVLRRTRNLSSDDRSDFLQEARTIARLHHPNIVAIHDAGVAEGRPFLVMELLGQVSLRRRLQQGGLREEEALRITCKIADALSAAHSRGILHLDVKPENILFGVGDEPKLSDFGISRALGEGAARADGGILGTPDYLPPEVLSGATLDDRADLYSLATVLYEMLSGHVPFEEPGESPRALAFARLSREATPLHHYRPSVAPELEQLVMRALARDPEGRYPSLAAFQQALETYASRGAAPLLEREVGAAAPFAAPAPLPGPRVTRPIDVAEAPILAELAPTAAAPPSQSAMPPPGAVANQRQSRSLRPGLFALLGLLGLLLCGGLFMLSGGLSDPVAEDALRPLVAASAVPDEPTVVREARSAAEFRASATPVPTASEIPLSTQTAVPATATPPPPTEPPPPPPTEPPPPPTEPPPPPPTAVPAAPSGGAQTLRLDDDAWQGGYNLSRGSNVYAGRTARWIYGRGSGYDRMAAGFNIQGQPAGEAALSIEGMDSEGSAKTPIRIMVNGTEIYRGPNPLPNDDQPLESGTWATYTWRFDGALLRPGENVIVIDTLAEGEFGLPPFFMLDYASLSFVTR